MTDRSGDKTIDTVKFGSPIENIGKDTTKLSF